MTQLTLGHRLARELTRRGNWRSFFTVAGYRELRLIDSVDDLADFLDRSRYRCVRASANVDEVADDIVIEQSKSGTLAPAAIGLFAPFVGIMLIPVMLLWRALWRNEKDEA
jgi:hypothetical protein